MSQSDNSREGILSRSGIANDVPQGIGKAPWTNTPAAPLPSALRTALAGLIGNVLEWFDFAVYGYFASDIGHLFFPQSSPAAQPLLAFAVFALGFFARPVGSLALGMIGDRIGRRALLTLSIALMGGATLIMGLLPTYQQIGVAAPLLLVAMRMIQGFSVGGEFTGSMVFTTESAFPLTRGLISSSTAAGTTIGFILGSGSAWLITSWLSAEQVADWGWRVPFVASVLFCIVGWLLRRGLLETAEGLKAVAIRPPLLPSLIADWLPMVRTFGIVATTNAAYYLAFTYMVERRRGRAGGGSVFLLANALSLIVVLIAKPLGGWLSDRVGRRRLMLILTVAIACLIYPVFRLMLSGTPQQFLLGQMVLAVPIGMALGLQGAMVVEISAPHSGDIDEYRLQRHPCTGGWNGSARVGMADRKTRTATCAGLLRHVARSRRPRLDVAHARDEQPRTR